MKKLILGDNPFFAVSHLDSSKSEEYLKDTNRFKNASHIIKESKILGISDFMISSHPEANDLLMMAGYSDEYKLDLPDLCIVIPNVHQINKDAAENGLFSALKKLISLISFKRKSIIKALSGLNFSKNIKYIALHNIVSDMLIGLNSKLAFKTFYYLCKFIKVKSVIITLNPNRLLEMDVKCDVICTYYNSNGYNVCYEFEELKNKMKANKAIEFWAMGIAASGAIQEMDFIFDENLEIFDGALIASSKLERITDTKSYFTKNAKFNSF